MTDTANRYPPGWDEERILDVLEHYEGQTDDELAAEIDAAFGDKSQTVMVIPNEIVPAVRALLPTPRPHPRQPDPLEATRGVAARTHLRQPASSRGVPRS